LKYISIVAHSLGGLIARYAIGQLYRAPVGHLSSNGLDTEAPQEQATVFGLQPINFITIATPHFGSRGNWQVSKVSMKL
jgi:triacylglycerol esterase/lipase EstA (alpha/beta hydrolase family)